MLLSQPARPTKPSKRSANTTVSTESVMTSRDTSEARMPSWPMLIPSLTVIVPNSSGYPPAANTPSFTWAASLCSVMLHGVTSFHAEATPTCGFTQSSSPMPTARSIARAGALRMPSVTSRLRGLTSTGVPGTLVVADADGSADSAMGRGYSPPPAGDEGVQGVRGPPFTSECQRSIRVADVDPSR